MGGFRLHSRSGRCGNGHHQMVGSPPEPIGQSRAATRPQPVEFHQAEMGGGGARDSDIRVSGPKRLGGLSEQTWPPASNKARGAVQLRTPAWGTEGL
jgi:hypothetical protein